MVCCEILREEINTIFREASEFDKEFEIFSCMQDFIYLLEQASALAANLSRSEKYALLRKYIEETGDVCVASKTKYQEYSLGEFVQEFRRDYKKNILPASIVSGLNELGFVWSVAVSVYDYPDILAEYKKEFGNLNIKAHQMYKGRNIGSIKHSLKQLYRNGKVPPDVKAKLDELGFNWELERPSVSFEKWVSLLQEYAAEHGNLDIPQKYVHKGYNLGSAVCTFRKAYHRGSLSKERFEILDAMGFVWKDYSNNVSQEEKFKLFAEYKAEFGALEGVTMSTMYKGYPIGKWIFNYRSEFKSREGRISKAAVDRLTAIDPNWLFSSKFSSMTVILDVLQAYKNEFGNLDVPRTYIYRGKSLGALVVRLRRSYSKGELSNSDIEELNKLGFIWRKPTAAEEYLEIFEGYKAKFGKLDFKFEKDEEFNGKNLRKCVQRIRRLYVTDRIPADLIKKFESLGLVWTERKPKRMLNEDMVYDVLYQYKAEFGNLNFGKGAEYKGYKMREIRASLVEKRKRGTLSKDYIDKLSVLGFNWGSEFE